MKKISVVIPAHNEEEALPATLRAILAQDHPDYEVIVVDNASKDRTSEVARSFPGVRVLHEERKGTMWACERGRCEAVGEIIVRMDADCLPESDWLSRGAKHFDDRKNVVVSGPYDYHDDTGRFRSLALFIQKHVFYYIHRFLQMLGLGGITMGGNTFIRAESLEKAGGFNTALTFYGDDTDVPKRLSKHGVCVYERTLVMKTSARRFKKDGVLRLQARYTYHFLKQIFGDRFGIGRDRAV